MAIEEGLRTLLLGQLGISLQVPGQTLGLVAYQGVFNEYPDQGVNPPFLVISQTDFDPMECLDGTEGMETSVFDIDCYATNHPDAVALAKAVSDFLKDYSGPAGAADTINAVHWENKRYDRVPIESGTDARHQMKKLTFRIQHTAA